MLKHRHAMSLGGSDGGGKLIESNINDDKTGANLAEREVERHLRMQ